MDPDADPYSTIIKIIVLLILIILSALFSSAETAFVSSSRVLLRQLIQEGNKRAKKVEQILENKDEMLSTILVGNNFVNLFASSLTTTLVYDIYGNMFVSLGTGILTFVILVFGEILPKTIAGKYPEKLAMTYSTPLYFLIKILKPIVWIVNGISLGIMKLLRIKTSQPNQIVTEDVIKTMLDMSLEDDQIQQEEHEIINDVLELDDLYAKDVMVPKSNIVGINVTDTYDDVMNVFKQEKYSRLVVFDETKENIIGIINIKDILFADKENFKVEDIMRSPYITYETKKISELLKDLKKTTNNIAIILNEYGDIEGLLTIEDILEELVGEIRDEYDADELQQIKKVDENSYEIEGSVNLNDINKTLNLGLESDEYQSLGGYFIEKIGKIPEKGENVKCDNIYMEILEIINNKIEKIKLTIC